MRKWTRGIKILIIALIITATLRCFLIESYRMPTTEMENSIKCGDFIFVDKTAYDTHPANRNDIVVYNVPELVRSFISTPASISRCIGLPGDTLEVFGTEYYINGKKLSNSPDLILPFVYDEKHKAEIENTMRKLGISIRPSTENKKNLTIIYLSRYESYLIKCELSDFKSLQLHEKNNLSYKLIIPAKNMLIKLTPESLSKYRQVILREDPKSTNVEVDNLLIQGEKIEYYQFKEDYYWLLSDNPDASSDSRHFGFIPHSHLIGKAQLIWFSKDPKQDIFTGYQWNRILTKVH